MGDRSTPEAIGDIRTLSAQGLPPVVSEEALAAMVGINSGLVWSFLNRTWKHYRTFEIPKGNGVRQINAPRVALKIVQKWLSVNLAKFYEAPEHVFGFVAGRSHIDAAMRHIGAKWAFSADISDFFPSTPEAMVAEALQTIGYSDQSSRIIARLGCLGGRLAQGAPTSPLFSNLCFRQMDSAVLELSHKYECRLTRYADDLVFSGQGDFPNTIRDDLTALFANGPWHLAPQKMLVQPLKGRIKVHGLLVNDSGVRLTRGYRNQIRAYAHLLATRGDQAMEAPKLIGHVEHARHVQRVTGSPSGISKNEGVERERIIIPPGIILPDRQPSADDRRPEAQNESFVGWLKRILNF